MARPRKLPREHPTELLSSCPFCAFLPVVETRVVSEVSQVIPLKVVTGFRLRLSLMPPLRRRLCSLAPRSISTAKDKNALHEACKSVLVRTEMVLIKSLEWFQRALQRFSRKVFGYLLASCMRMFFRGPGRIVGHLRGGGSTLHSNKE